MLLVLDDRAGCSRNQIVLVLSSHCNIQVLDEEFSSQKVPQDQILQMILLIHNIYYRKKIN